MPRTSPPPYHHGNLAPALLAAAMQILRSDGVAALSLREVARRAGVSHQAPYHHFSSRAHLLAALATTGFEQLAAELERVQRKAPDPMTAAQASGVRYVTFAAANPERFRLMFGAELGSRANFPALEAAAQRVFALLVRPFGLTLERTDTAPGDVVLTLWSSVHGLAALAVEGQIPQSGKALAAAARGVTRRLWLGVREAFTSSVPAT